MGGKSPLTGTVKEANVEGAVGRGKFITETEEIPVGPGICIYNPPGGKHRIVNTGNEILKFVWIYAPQLASHRVQK